ncbi:hypothetical protein AtNW77_Chr3g0195771 [Arabidopsis thaliana]
MIAEIYLNNTYRMKRERACTVCPLDPGSPLFLSGDGFEPAGVLFPNACFHFPSKDKRRRTTLWTRSSTSIAACAMKGSVWASRGKR